MKKIIRQIFIFLLLIFAVFPAGIIAGLAMSTWQSLKKIRR